MNFGRDGWRHTTSSAPSCKILFNSVSLSTNTTGPVASGCAVDGKGSATSKELASICWGVMDNGASSQGQSDWHNFLNPLRPGMMVWFSDLIAVGAGKIFFPNNIPNAGVKQTLVLISCENCPSGWVVFESIQILTLKISLSFCAPLVGEILFVRQTLSHVFKREKHAQVSKNIKNFDAWASWGADV